MSSLQKSLTLFFSSPFSMKQPLSLKKIVTMQLLYHTFEFSEVVIEFMEIVKFGVRM